MGLDIQIHVDNSEEVFTPDYYDLDDINFHKHSLSRTFCKFMSRRDVIAGEPELDQIGKITGLNIQPLYDMNNYGSDEYLQSMLDYAKTEQEKIEILKKFKTTCDKLKGNIDLMIPLITQLIEKLSKINNLPKLLRKIDPDRDTLNNDSYFANFNINEGDGYINNNFGHDLRNFQSFLLYAKSKGSRTVYFAYG
jgi:hypothetical protein